MSFKSAFCYCFLFSSINVSIYIFTYRLEPVADYSSIWYQTHVSRWCRSSNECTRKYTLHTYYGEDRQGLLALVNSGSKSPSQVLRVICWPWEISFSVPSWRNTIALLAFMWHQWLTAGAQASWHLELSGIHYFFSWHTQQISSPVSLDAFCLVNTYKCISSVISPTYKWSFYFFFPPRV